MALIKIIPVKLNSVKSLTFNLKSLTLNHHTSRQLKFYKLSFFAEETSGKTKMAEVSIANVRKVYG